MSRLRRLTLNVYHCGTSGLSLPSSIQQLEFGFWSSLIVRQDLDNLKLPALEHLTFLNPLSGSIIDLTVSILDICRGQLQSLVLQNFDDVNFDILQYCFGTESFSRLETLAITHDSHVTDDVMELIGSHCPSLKSIDLSWSRLLTGVGVKSIVARNGSLLKKLNLTGCENVSPDTVSWAKSQGVKIEYKFPELGKKGKKLLGQN